jgi:hypothetical protein
MINKRTPSCAYYGRDVAILLNLISMQKHYSFHHLVLSSALSCSSSSSDLDHLTGKPVVAPQDRPAGAICLSQCHLQLGAQNSELALFGLDARV